MKLGNLQTIKIIKMDLEKIVTDAIMKYPDKVTEYKNGKTGMIGLFLGEAMKMSKGKADPKELNRIVKEKLDNIK